MASNVMAPKWIDVDEALPAIAHDRKYSSRVLFASRCCVWIGQLWSDAKWVNDANFICHGITHWALLPGGPNH